MTPEEAKAPLEDLRRMNRWFGGISTTASLLRRAMHACRMNSASVLEVAAGDGYSITHAVRRLERESLRVEPVCLDRRAMKGAACCKREVVGDALELTFAAESFDFVSCALFVHHLAAEQVVDFVNGALRVARHAVLINDVRRSPLHLALLYAAGPVFRSAVAHTDGIASVKQAYSPEELRALLTDTAAASVELRTRFLFRIGATAWKHMGERGPCD